MKSGPRPLTDEEREEKEAAKEAAANSKRFQLVRRSTGTWGVFDDLYGTLVSVFHSRDEAVEALINLTTGKPTYE